MTEPIEREWQRDTEWQKLSARTEKKCRSMTRENGRNIFCKQPAVAQMRRRRRSGVYQWWAYCGCHLFGRKIRGGVVCSYNVVAP